jgi:protein SEY1
MFIGPQPVGAEPEDEEDLAPIGGVDEEEGKSLEEEMTVLSESKRQELVVRFKKMADGVYVEAKRSAIGGITQVPLYFYVILLVLGWNEIVMGECSPGSAREDSANDVQFCEIPFCLC